MNVEASVASTPLKYISTGQHALCHPTQFRRVFPPLSAQITLVSFRDNGLEGHLVGHLVVGRTRPTSVIKLPYHPGLSVTCDWVGYYTLEFRRTDTVW